MGGFEKLGGITGSEDARVLRTFEQNEYEIWLSDAIWEEGGF